MPGPWGPPTLNNLGFVAHHATLSRGDSGRNREKAITQDSRERLLEVLNGLNAETLKGDDQNTLARIEPDKPWLLTPREIELLERLQPPKN